MTNSVFITGCNRGLGLEFTKEYAEDGWKVYASCRHPEQANELQNLSQKFSNIEILKLDVRSEAEIESVSSKLKNVPIDILINNAGVIEQGQFDLAGITEQEIIDLFNVNAIGPLFVSRALLPNLKLGKMKILASLSSALGSLTANIAGDWNHYAYKASKAALNMFMLSLSAEPTLQDFRVILLDPGWVKTDMGGQNAELDPATSITGLRKVLMKKDLKTGTYINRHEETVPW